MGIGHHRIIITGRVQGVGFRKATVEYANSLGLSGFAMNLEDGSVLVEAEGDADRLHALLIWCRTGPPAAIVENVVMTEGTVVGHHGFATKR